MSLEVKNSESLTNSKVSLFFYGVSGAGKTRLSCSLPDPLVLLFDDGLKSTMDLKVDWINPESWEEILQVIQYLKTHSFALEKEIEWKGKKYKSLIIDSITEMHRTIIKGVLKLNRRELPQQQDWGLASDRVKTTLEALLSLPVHICATALEEIDKDELIGKIYARPLIPGKLANLIPALFDEVFNLRTEQKQDGSVQRVALTAPDSIYIGRDRSGLLQRLEPFDLKSPRENQIWKKLGITK